MVVVVGFLVTKGWLLGVSPGARGVDGNSGRPGVSGRPVVFATPLNSLFLVYVAALGLAVWSAVTLVRFLDLPAFERRIGPRMPARPLSAVVLVIAVLNTAAWLMPIVRAVLGPDPQCCWRAVAG